MKLLFTFLLLSSVCFGQSKKEQIETLNHSIDSLNTVLSTTRDNSCKDIGRLNTTIDGLNSEIAELKSDVSSLELSTTKLTKENSRLQTDLEDMSKTNLKAIDARLNPIKKLIGYWSAPQWCCHFTNENCDESAGLYDIEFIQFSFDSLKLEASISVYENTLTIIAVESNESQNKFIIYFKTFGDYLNDGPNRAIYDLGVGTIYVELINNKLLMPNKPDFIRGTNWSDSIQRVKCE